MTTPNTTPRRLPCQSAIRKHWADRLWRIKGFDSLEEFLEPDHCFACGFGGSERCHILARAEGGDDSAENLHILCSVCHKDSEFLTGCDYTQWLYDRSIIDRVFSQSMRVGFNISKHLLFNHDSPSSSTKKPCNINEDSPLLQELIR